jgi:hypothetical protein
MALSCLFSSFFLVSHRPVFVLRQLPCLVLSGLVVSGIYLVLSGLAHAFLVSTMFRPGFVRSGRSLSWAIFWIPILSSTTHHTYKRFLQQRKGVAGKALSTRRLVSPHSLLFFFSTRMLYYSTRGIVCCVSSCVVSSCGRSCVLCLMSCFVFVLSLPCLGSQLGPSQPNENTKTIPITIGS